jgi:predicted RNase H-like nuclease
VAIDIPIGLPDTGRRQADALARSLLGPRASSVFTTPTRAAITAPAYAEAAEQNRNLAGQGLSQQAFALAPRILEVDSWVRSADVAVIEVHPEVSFVRMAGGTPLAASKHTWAGAMLRRCLLAKADIGLPDDLGEAGVLASVDDVHDAAVAAWTARRYRHGQATPIPDPPEVFGDGWACAIWM